MVTQDEDDERDCPVCDSEMRARILAQKTDAFTGLNWVKSGYICEDCGYRGATWEATD